MQCIYIFVFSQHTRGLLSLSRVPNSQVEPAQTRGAAGSSRDLFGRLIKRHRGGRLVAMDARVAYSRTKKKCLEGEAAERDSRGSGGNGGGGDGDGDGRGGEDDDGNIEGRRGLGVNEHVDGVGRGKGESPPFLTLPPPPPPLSFDSCDYCC